ncbi:hypothetical protein CEXT_177231 [Caerostris extrusa]|uniref:Transposase n=1 Tax=Caerostris extrusa TaxID=172846 RepID=A0AAV4M990_CAEEX|nr:hypothetical protein CEXT_177231 [Caerostris extrusa]
MAEHVSADDIYHRMQNVYRTECLSRATMFRWLQERTKVEENSPRPGQESLVITEETVTALDNLVRNTG